MVAQRRPGGKPAGSPGTDLNPSGRPHVPEVMFRDRLRPTNATSADRATLTTVLIAAVTVLAHQGGWDEMLMVLTPIAVFALLLKLANSRAKAAQAARQRAAGPTPANEATASEPTPE